MRPIDADELKEAMEEHTDYKGYLVCAPEEVIDLAPTIERPHGEWIKGREIAREMLADETLHIDYENFTCSNCGLVLDRLLYHVDGSPFYKFCPNCGSDNRPRENNSSSIIINGKYSENVEYGTRIEIGEMKGGE